VCGHRPLSHAIIFVLIMLDILVQFDEHFACTSDPEMLLVPSD
jgi:hypothetical protein